MANTDDTLKQVKFDERKPEQFSLPCVRRLYQYLGEYDALVELTELAARSFIHDAKVSNDIPKFVNSLSERHNVKVYTGEFDQFSTHLARSYVVTMYQAAERFLHQYRREHTELTGVIWTGDAMGSNPLSVTLQNIAQSATEAEAKIGSDLVSRFQYYRKVRNWVCHEKDKSDVKKPEKLFDEIVDYYEDNSDLETCAAPNRPKCLTFDDFLLFTRVTKKIADKLNQLVTPSVAELKKKCRWEDFKPLLLNPTRMKNAITGRLRTEFGLDEDTATTIAQDIVGSQA